MEQISKWLSAVFSPILSPTFVFAGALWITPLAEASERTRLISALGVFLITAMIPLATIIVLMRLGKVSDTAITDRRQRTLPFIVAILSYVGAALYIRGIHGPVWVTLFFLGAAAAATCALAINTRWKISAHATSMAGMTTFYVWLTTHGLCLYGMLPWISGCVLLCGAVGTARLVLDKHTPAQVYAGWALGAACCTVFLSFL